MLAPEFIPIWGGVGSYTVELLKSLPLNMDIHVVTLNRHVGLAAGYSSNGNEVESIIARPLKVHYLTNSSETFFYNFPFQSSLSSKGSIIT